MWVSGSFSRANKPRAIGRAAAAMRDARGNVEELAGLGLVDAELRLDDGAAGELEEQLVEIDVAHEIRAACR